MAVTREALHQLIDQLDPEFFNEIYEHIQDLSGSEEVELTDGEIEGLWDQDAYFEEGEENAYKTLKGKDLSARDKL